MSTRTTNANEMHSKTANIGALWQKFDDEIFVNYKEGQRIYGVYYNYESNANGEFDVLVGYASSNDTLESIKIKKEKYLLFEGKGEMPQAVIQTWAKIWEFFSKENVQYERIYTTDFEYYKDEKTVQIHISIK